MNEANAFFVRCDHCRELRDKVEQLNEDAAHLVRCDFHDFFCATLKCEQCYDGFVPTAQGAELISRIVGHVQAQLRKAAK